MWKWAAKGRWLNWISPLHLVVAIDCPLINWEGNGSRSQNACNTSRVQWLQWLWKYVFNYYSKSIKLNNFLFCFLFRGMTAIVDWIGCELKEVCKTLWCSSSENVSHSIERFVTFNFLLIRLNLLRSTVITWDTHGLNSTRSLTFNISSALMKCLRWPISTRPVYWLATNLIFTLI